MEGGRVWKAGQGAEPWPRRRIRAAEWMAAGRAEAMIAGAEAEAEAVRLAAADDRAAAVEEGLREGRRAASAQLADRLAALAEAQRAWLVRAEEEALDLAVEMARRIVGQELRADPTAAAQGALLALRAAGRRRALRVRLPPQTVAQLQERTAHLVEASAGASLELVADPALRPGDVVVETEAGHVDGRIDTRLAAYRATLEGGAP
jgi:flagellar assembly protein FliH